MRAASWAWVCACAALWNAALVRAHVPAYDCKNSCCHGTKYDINNPDNPEDVVTQAHYFKGAGGVEFDVGEFDTSAEGQLIYIDVVFKEEYPRDAYTVFIGCGGCDLGDERFAEAIVDFEGYGAGKFEPFTQTYYRSFFVNDHPTFNTTLLGACTQTDHWSVRVERNLSSTSMSADEPLFWSAVFGKDREFFDLVDLFHFPTFAYKNHGEDWNEMRASIFVIAGFVLVFALLLLLFYGSSRDDALSYALAYEDDSAYRPSAFDFFTHTGYYAQRTGEKVVVDASSEEAGLLADGAQLVYVVFRRDAVFTIRSVLYTLAILAIIVDFFEVFVHGSYAVSNVQAEGSSVAAFFFLVVVWGRIVPLVIVCWIFDAMRRHAPNDPTNSWTRYVCCSFERVWGCLCCCCMGWVGCWHPVLAHVNWAFVEILTGLSFLFFFFGVGYYVAPFAVILAGLVRLWDYHYLDKDRIAKTGPVDNPPAEDRVALPPNAAVAAPLPPLSELDPAALAKGPGE
jgi:hypothetical protein